MRRFNCSFVLQEPFQWVISKRYSSHSTAALLLLCLKTETFTLSWRLSENVCVGMCVSVHAGGNPHTVKMMCKYDMYGKFHLDLHSKE